MVPKLRELRAQGYEGAMPDGVLIVTLRNKGRSVASNIYGDILMNAWCFYPIEVPGFNVKVGSSNGSYSMSLHGPEGKRIAPELPRHDESFPPPNIPGQYAAWAISVKVVREGTNTIKFSFTSEQGDHVEGTQDVVNPRLVDAYDSDPRNVRE